MTNIQTWLDQSKTLAGQATEGPWEAYSDSDVQYAGCPPTVENLVYAGTVEEPIIDWGNGSTKADAEFIADARTRLPQTLNALQAVLDLHKKRHPSPQMWRIAPDSNEPQPVTTPDTCDYCRRNYPCPTVRAIQDAIGDSQ